MMRKETIYGTLELTICESGIIVKSDIPFFSFEEEFAEEELKKAKAFYYEKEKELEEIIRKMEERKKIKTIASGLPKQINTLIESGLRKILLFGPTGTGKTHSLFYIAKGMVDEGKIEDFLLFTLSSGMEDLDLLGKYIPRSDRSLQFQKSELLEYLELAKDNKIAIILDEFNRTHPKALNVLIPLLDEKDGKVRVNNFITGQVIEIPAENLYLFFTANFGASYSGTFQIDDALYNRFDAVIFVDYQKELEKELLADFKCREAVLELAAFLRKLWREKNAVNPITTRDIQNMARLIEPYFPCNPADFINHLKPILVYKAVKHDIHGYPDEDTIKEIEEFINSEEFSKILA